MESDTNSNYTVNGNNKATYTPIIGIYRWRKPTKFHHYLKGIWYRMGSNQSVCVLRAGSSGETNWPKVRWPEQMRIHVTLWFWIKREISTNNISIYFVSNRARFDVSQEICFSFGWWEWFERSVIENNGILLVTRRQSINTKHNNSKQSYEPPKLLVAIRVDCPFAK